MAWIESHQSLLTHRKTGRLARALGLSRVHAVGHLHAFWWWCMDNAPDGKLTDCIPAEIAEAAAWEGDAELFVSSMLMSGFLDGSSEGLLTVHDWMDYAGKLVERRKSDRERKRLAGKPKDFRRNSNGTPSDGARTQPNRTQPNPTEEESLAAIAAASAARDAKVSAALDYLRQVFPADLAEYAAETIRGDGTSRADPAGYFVKIVGMIKGQFNQAPAPLVVKAWEAARAKDAGIGYAKTVLRSEIKKTVAAAVQPTRQQPITLHPVDADVDPDELAELKRLKELAERRAADAIAAREAERHAGNV